MKYIYQMTPEELVKQTPRLTLALAKEYILSARAIRNSLIKQGRCTHCGTKGHKEEDCQIFKDHQRDLARGVKEKEAREHRQRQKAS